MKRTAKTLDDHLSQVERLYHGSLLLPAGNWRTAARNAGVSCCCCR